VLEADDGQGLGDLPRIVRAVLVEAQAGAP
jgi:hypothetical protein